MKNPHPRPTKTRAAIDRFLYDLYYQLYDGPRRNVTAILEHHHLDFSIIQDLRQLGALESVGTKRGQKHRWIGPYPTAQLGDDIEALREERRLKRRAQEQREQVSQESHVDQLLDLRNRIDRKLAELGGQSRLF